MNSENRRGIAVQHAARGEFFERGGCHCGGALPPTRSERGACGSETPARTALKNECNCARSNTSADRRCSAYDRENGCYRMQTEFDRDFSLAMSYVPWQNFAEVLPSCKGLRQGSIFSELIKPFGRGRGGTVCR